MSDLELSVIILSIKTALVSTVLMMPVAIWLGWISARKTFPLKSILEALIFLPLTAPPVVTGYLLLIALGKRSVIGRAAYDLLGVHFTFNFAALVIASMVVSLPLAVRAIRSAFELIDPAYEYASLTLGASKAATFFRVTLPLALPGVLSGAVLGFARSLGEFGATITLAGNIPGKTQTVALLIYSHMEIPGRETETLRLVAFSIALSIGAVALSEWMVRRRAYFKK